jgi:hypothetical protein
MWRFERRTFYTSSLRVKLILACQEVQKMSLALKEPYEIGSLFIHFQTLPPSMDYKWKAFIDHMENQKGTSKVRICQEVRDLN